jgi:hypothetical protein
MTINIVFFGGYMATEHDVTVWADSAKEQRSDLNIRTQPWVTGASATNPLVRYGIVPNQWASIINGWKDETYIVGHSSGCAIANKVQSRVADKTKKHLICLDGFLPYKNQIEEVNTQIWSASYDDKFTSAKVTYSYYSLNYNNLRNALVFPQQEKHWHVYNPLKKCTKTWSLHFSLVNENSSDDIVTSIPMGYYDCKANLSFLT